MQNPTPRRGALAAVFVLNLNLAGAALAQTPPPPPPPDAGTLRQQIERSQQPALPQASRPQPPRPPEMKPSGTLVVTVKRFEFRGNRLLDEAVLQKVVAPWLNRPVGFNDLQAAAAAVADAYRDAGWVVRVYLPEQDIAEGRVAIQVVEAVLGNVRVDAGSNLRFSTARARDIALAAQPAGQPLNANAVDRAMLILGDVPGLSARGNLAEGQADGQTDLVVRLDARPLWSGDAAVDNTGSRSTGPERFTANVSANSAFGQGERLSGNAILTRGSNYLRVAGTMPVGARGLRAGASVSTLSYRVIAPEFETLQLKGDSQTFGLDAVYPVIRSVPTNLFLTANADFKRYANSSAGTPTSDYKVQTQSLGLSGSHFDEWGRGGVSSGSATLTLGKVDLAGSPNAAADAAGARTQGQFTKLRYSASRQQTLSPSLSLNVALSGQTANRNLESGEKFFLGGANGVRAYPNSEAGGASGQLVSVELRWRMRSDLTVTGLYDWGQVRVNQDNGFAGAAAKNRLALQGLGASVSWAAPRGIAVQATLATRIGSNPNPAPSGTDQDGSLRKARLWVSASYPF